MRFEGKYKRGSNGLYCTEIGLFQAAECHQRLFVSLFRILDGLENQLAHDYGVFTKLVIKNIDPKRKTFQVQAPDSESLRALTAMTFKKLRKRASIGQKEAARLAELANKSGWVRYERGERMPTIAQFDRLLRAICEDNEPVIKIVA